MLLSTASRRLFAILAAYVLPTLAQDQSAGISPDTLLEGMKTVTIYDSISTSTPYELRERGSITYSPTNRSGTFSESGVLSRPLDGATKLYRIGTEELMAIWIDPQAITNGDEDVSVDETLTLYLDTKDELFHTSYHIARAERQPGTFIVKVDHMLDHLGSNVKIEETKKTTVGGRQANVDSEGNEVPEKTFLQKYWIYAIPLVLVLVMSGGGEQ